MFKLLERRIVVRLVLAWLSLLIGVGLWQGYAEWLLGGGGRVL